MNNNSNCFNRCFALEELQTYYDPNDSNGYLTGDLDLQYSTKLSRTSIENLINGSSPITSDKTITLSLTAVNKAFETSEGANDGETSTEWLTLKDTKPNWTFVLV